MGDTRGFLKLARQNSQYRDVSERIRDFADVSKEQPLEQSQEQASRCMDCATPFCHWACPIGNYIPEWNDYMFKGNWQKAVKLLEAANNLPEITGRVCPAICEYACVLGLNSEAATIRENERAIIEFGFKHGFIKPKRIEYRTGKKIAVIGSGPAGLSCAVELNRTGHQVTVFERDKKIGGILRFGIPDFKLEKHLLDRRIALWQKEGVVFKTGVDAGKDYSAQKILDDFDAVCLAGGARVPRDLNIEVRTLKGIYFAMDYLVQANRLAAGENIPENELISAKGKKVVIIGGGDTGADCLGIAHRQGASSVIQIEVMPKPPVCRSQDYPWPQYPLILKTTSSHEEGGVRHWAVLTKNFIGKNNVVRKLSCVKVEFTQVEGKTSLQMKEIPASNFEIEADLVILAIGFLGPEKSGLISELNVEFNQCGNVKTDGNYMTSREKIFSAGDMRRGQSLVVWAIAEGRQCASCIDKYLMGERNLSYSNG
ncbi:MAG: glutamate synthase subunit beta [Candidatus Omnitrophota bacterium]